MLLFCHRIAHHWSLIPSDKHALFSGLVHHSFPSLTYPSAEVSSIVFPSLIFFNCLGLLLQVFHRQAKLCFIPLVIPLRWPSFFRLSILPPLPTL